MGKMAEGVHFTGTIGNISYYEVGDRTYVRMKSSLSRKRVLKSREFARTRRYASDLGIASRIASQIYKALPSDIKGRWLFRAITGEAASLLYTGSTEQEVKDSLWKKYITDTGCGNEDATGANCVNPIPSTKEAERRLKTVFLNRWEEKGKPSFYFKYAWRDKTAFNPASIPRSEYVALRASVKC